MLITILSVFGVSAFSRLGRGSTEVVSFTASFIIIPLLSAGRVNAATRVGVGFVRRD